VLETAPHTTPTDNVPRSALVVSDLAGRTRVLARFSGRLEQVGSFDASTRTVAWASRHVTRTRLDCPPSRQWCMVRKTGTLTIWQANIAGGAARPRQLGIHRHAMTRDSPGQRWLSATRCQIRQRPRVKRA
jgi:hypothetical protein